MATFDQSFAESGRQSELDALRQSGGYAAAKAAYDAGGGSSTASGGGGQSAVDIAKQLMALSDPHRKEAIGTLQARTPEREAAYGGLTSAAEGQKPTIEQRYKDTLADITKTTRGAASNTFTRRGIPLSSGLVEQTVGAQLGPQIQQAATNRDANLQGIDRLLADIGIAKSKSGDSLAQAISAIQNASGSDAISSALSIFGTQESSRQSQLNRDLEQSLSDTESPYTTLSEGQTLYNLITGQPEFTANKTYKPTEGGGQTAADFLTQWGVASSENGVILDPNAPTYSTFQED